MHDLEHEREQSLHQQNRLRGELGDVGDELAGVLGSRMSRTGHSLWNKLPFGYLSRKAKKSYRLLLDRRDRTLLLGARLLRPRRSSTGTAVVAASREWPNPFHSFVYQEMVGIAATGLDVRLFHWDLGDTGGLSPSFRRLLRNRTQLQPITAVHRRDRKHFEKNRPGRLRAFLERVAEATGRDPSALEEEPIVLQGCTFARMAELAGARYLHSYFFYDQSFMAMQAAWLLELPRGITCYADHMLDDHPFKLVPLHLELADLVVATSRRIERELSDRSGGRFDGKILVKPNGVDGSRFRQLDRPTRKSIVGLEVVSISRLEPKKGLTYLAEAIAELKQRGRRVVAHVIGGRDLPSRASREYAELFRQTVSDLGVQDEVVLHGTLSREQMFPILERCSTFVAPYVETPEGDKDGIPTALLEAMACGLAVVTTDSGSIPEAVDDGVEAIVVPQRNGTALANALERLLENPEEERRLATAARVRFERQFDITVTETALHERIAGLVAGQR